MLELSKYIEKRVSSHAEAKSLMSDAFSDLDESVSLAADSMKCVCHAQAKLRRALEILGSDLP